MNTNKTWEELRQLKLQGMANRYSAILEQPLHQQPEAYTMMAMLTKAESEQRTQQRTQVYLKLAKLRYSAHVEQVYRTDCISSAGWMLLEMAQSNCSGQTPDAR
jgi:hypothetical protein